jgi:hypothetical protein
MTTTYKNIYSKNGLEVFVNPSDFWADYKISLNGHHAKKFYGETAWMDVTRFVHDQAMEFYDFNVDDIHNQLHSDLVDALLKKFTVEENDNG